MQEMREILFRGKAASGWVYGSPHPGKESGHVILFDKGSPLQMVFDWVYVDSETIGQYTGLKDKNGVKIFEGDIVRINQSFIEIGTVEWEGTAFVLNEMILDYYYRPHIEVIGNIHDNPELLEEGK
jgi:hypothetical protein